MLKLTPVLALCATLGLTACGGGEDKATETETAATTPAETAAPAAAPQAAPATFDLTKVAVSTAPLGAFPYLGVPAGYEVRDTKTLDLAAFPIWNGAGFLTVEGKVYMANSKTPEGKTYSRLEFERGVENAVKAAGGVQVAKGVAPNDVIENVPSTLRDEVGLGLGPIWGNPITAYVIRRADRTIWIQTVSDTNQTAWTVVDAPAAP